MPNVPEFENRFLLDKEKEYLGIYVSGHPLDEYNEVLSKYISNSTLDFAFEEEDFSNPNKITDGTEVIVGGIVTTVKNITLRAISKWHLLLLRTFMAQ